MRRSRKNGQLRRTSSRRPRSHRHDHHAPARLGGLAQNDAKRIAHKRPAPKLQAGVGRPLMADAVDRRHENAVGDGVGPLD